MKRGPGDITRGDGRYGESGFTLIELLMVLAITGLVLTGLFSFYLAGVSAWQQGADRMDYQQTARISLERMISDLRFASSVTIENPERISYRFPHDPVTYTYRKQGEELVHEYRNGVVAHTKIALGITSLSFKDINGNIDIIVKAGPETAPVIMRSCVWPRNVLRE